MLYVVERGFRALVEHAPDAIVVSRDGIVLYANHAAARLLAHDSAEELVGKPMTFLDPRELETMRRRIQQLADGGGMLVPREYPAKRRDGTLITAEIASTIIEFDGAPAVLAYARDVTERTRLRAQIAHADRLASLGMMAAGVAHEINNPLTFVGLAAEMLSRKVSESEASLVRDVRSGIDRIAAIVRDLKFFGRTEEEPTGAVDLAIAIASAERLVAHEIRVRAQLESELGELPAVTGVARRIEQVFVNLLLNAAFAVENKPDARIAITTETHADRVVVSVRDNGVGIEPDKLEKIFEPFFTTREGNGTGLGLSICRDIVVRAGGDLVAKSTPGEGTTMLVTLLRATKERSSLKTIPAPPPQTEGTLRRILIVDDEPLIVSSLLVALSRAADVLGETSSERAFDLLSNGAFDAVVCDVMMPTVSGIDLHERIARANPSLASKFVFMTGGTYTARARDYLEKVSNPRLTKPFEIRDLVAAIEAVTR
jgi:PAS domain S-box-containing protein